ncbi:response regulator transcription factor [Paenibacillus tundrae]|uniref:response regulator transcription factor n=1 Tax=Paenibacillus tundrae TaxID=528187 RepID=UPI0022A92586|nr:response regulator transcription factor [Paenibacillus tundrae]MCZ1265364.1 DNA-binding response regulator [Paenibacillus tundrae]
MIRILIAEDQRMLRGALVSLLDLEDDLEVIGEAGNGEEALKQIGSLQPDLCLMDIEMPVMSGLDVAERIQQLGLPCRIIILTTFARPGFLERAIQAGVQGYLLKDEPSDRLAGAIRRVMSGGREVSPELVFGAAKETNPLTEREKEVLKLAATGMNANLIAASLHLSYGTVRNYLSEAFNKLDAKNRMEAVSIAEQKGWL